MPQTTSTIKVTLTEAEAFAVATALVEAREKAMAAYLQADVRGDVEAMGFHKRERLALRSAQFALLAAIEAETARLRAAR